MPDSIRNEADQSFFQAALDSAAAVLHGRHSHEGGPRAARRKRLVLTHQIAAIAPDVFWFQLYRAARNDHAIGFDLVRRAMATDCNALVLTLDVPVRTTRARVVRTGTSRVSTSA